VKVLLDEIRVLETPVSQIERQPTAVVAKSPACRLLKSTPGVGLLTATAIAAATGDTVVHFEKYLPALLTHGARSVLCSAARQPAEVGAINYRHLASHAVLA